MGVERTADHTGPRRAGAARARGALVVAFRAPRSLPVPLDGEVVGRAWFQSNGAPDDRISTRHLRFTWAGGGLRLEDAGSRNGSWVNGARLRPGERASLEDGAVVRAGRTLLVYREAFVGPDAPSPPFGGLEGPYGLREVEREVEAIARRRPTNVLISGETGTGKELVARVLAEAARPRARYAAVNVAALAPSIFESQLFGYVRGAYSGAGEGSRGIFVEHDKGAVFLDEIGELSLDLQVKLLRVLENREVLRVGDVKPTLVDVLIIAATNVSLRRAVARRRFRRDLLARFEAAHIELPPLRERAEDIFAIATVLAKARGEPLVPERVEVEAVERLLLEPWPSNVRELAAVLQKIARAAAPGELRLEALEGVLGARASLAPSSALTLEVVERAVAEEGTEAAAARRLGITRGKLRRFLDKARPKPG